MKLRAWERGRCRDSVLPRPDPVSPGGSLRTILPTGGRYHLSGLLHPVFRARSPARQREGPWDAASSPRCALSNCLLMTVNALSFRKDYFTKQNRLKVILGGATLPFSASWFLLLSGLESCGGRMERGARPGCVYCFLCARARDAGCGRGPTG